MPPRRASSPATPASTRVALLRRLAALEARVTCLETGKAGPGDGRATPRARVEGVKRCPGCGLPLRRRAGRCAACSRPLDVP